jgi:hypothetical protein
MNCISRLLIVTAAALLVASCGVPASGNDDASRSLKYSLAYAVRPNTADATVDVELQLDQDSHLLREMRFAAGSMTDLRGDGELRSDGATTTWLPPADGGTLRWSIAVAERRNGDGFDAWLGEDWGLFRAEDVIPRAATRTLKGAQSDTSLRFRLPRDWSVVTEYPSSGNRFIVTRPARRFAQPSGWIVMGDLGVRRETIDGVRVAVAAPRGQGMRRIDILALLNWSLPELARILPEMPGRLTIVGAGDPMWRGALSAPQSLYIHSGRPLISENGTSTLLHEVVHVALGLSTVAGYDWIVEGLAEYYSLQLLARTGTLSEARVEDAYDWQADWGSGADRLCANASTGQRTALAVTILHALDHEIQDATDSTSSLDDVVRSIEYLDKRIDVEDLRSAAAEILGRYPDALHIEKLPGCRTLADL